MSKQFFILIFIILITSISAFNKEELEKLMNNPEWIVGKGTSGSETDSDRMAINDLLSQITVQVQSSFSDIEIEENKNIKEFCSSAISTYSSARLDAAERSIFEKDELYIVYRYIKKADKERIFKGREKLIKDYARRGYAAEKELRIGDALMNYYWALILLRTHPNWDEISELLYDIDETLITYLPDRIRRIFSLLDLEVSNERYDEKYELTFLNLNVNFNGEAVRNLDIKYYLGNDWSLPVGVSHGKALLEFIGKPNEIPRTIKINVMYNDIYKASHNSDLRKVIEGVTCPVFRECRVRVKDSRELSSILSKPEVNLHCKKDSLDFVPYKKLINKICNAISSKDINKIFDLFTENGKSYYQRLIDYGNARLVVQNPHLTIDKIEEKVYVRGLPIQFSFPNSGRKFTEELIFVFNEDDKVERINFALSDKAIEDLLGDLIKISEVEKYQIINFIEEYKTAYCTENIDYIEKVFDDNALIIVGRMLEYYDQNIEGMYEKLGRNWRPVQYSKRDYIRNLSSLFSSNEYVNLHFEDTHITRTNSNTSKIFGVQIHQFYYSQHYADEGYLFLMFDLTVKDSSRIYVRTWQPEKNPDGSIYGLDNFFLPNK